MQIILRNFLITYNLKIYLLIFLTETTIGCWIPNKDASERIN